jgi:hypothetical protein
MHLGLYFIKVAHHFRETFGLVIIDDLGGRQDKYGSFGS